MEIEMMAPRKLASAHEGNAPGSPFEDVRVAPLLAIPVILGEHGVDPAGVLATVGLDARLFDDPENRVSFGDLGRLLDVCAKETNCAHFGLLIGQRFTLDSLGVLGRLMRNCPTLRDALRAATLHLHVHDRGAVSLTLDFGDGLAALGYSLIAGKTPTAEQILDGALAMQYLLLRDLCGRRWNPVRIQFSHGRPAKVAPFQRFFNVPVEFDAELSAIVFESSWLDHRIGGADPVAYAAITRAIESDPSQPMSSFAGKVRRSLHALIYAGSASSANIARLFDLHERTLRRRLRNEGATVRGLTGEVRRELAHHLLRVTELPISDVAAILRYSDVTVFSRAFRAWSNASPHEWRARQRSAH
jgi:AraC-like DNA-binding protein